MSETSAKLPPPPFAWWERRPYSIVLPGFILLSLFAHAATFFIFQAVYPQRVTIPPPAPQVSLLTPSTPENRALLDWVEAQNPALVASMAKAPAHGLAEATYHPSFERARTAPQTPPPVSEKTQFPPGRSALDLIRSIAPAPPVTPAGESTLTRVTFTGDLKRRHLLKAPAFSPSSGGPLESARFLIGVSDRGEVRYLFLQHSSGNLATDTDTADEIRHASFAPAEAEITWGVAIVSFGDDAYLRETSSSKSAAQPASQPEEARPQ